MNTLHLPALGSGDAFTTAEDLHRIGLALLDARIDSRDKRYGMGFWIHRTQPALILEGYDAGASFRSTHIIAAQTTASVLGNSSDGAWPVIGAFALG